MNNLSSNLSILLCLLFFCSHIKATTFEIKVPQEPHLVDDTITVQISARDLPLLTTSLQGSVSWTENSLTLMKVESTTLSGMVFNTEATDTLGFTWFEGIGEPFIGAQDIVEMTFFISPAMDSDTVRFSFGNSPARLEVGDGSFNTTSPETIDDAFLAVIENLPVELSAFNASPRDNAIYLDWTTESETNVEGFELQRAIDGHNFTTIQWLDARGNNTGSITYGYSDEAVTLGKTYYYRLKMQDLDGTYEYSNVISTKINGQRPVVEVYPNPAFNETTIAFEHFLSESVSTVITIYDNMGRKLQGIQHQTTIGNNKINIDVNDLDSGIYTITLAQGEYRTIQKLVVK